MKALTQLPFRKDTAPETPPQDERVVELFRSRNELKKQYDDLQREIGRQRDRLKQQEAATARLQEILDGLESKLTQPETAYPAMAFYHLRGLWATGRELLAAFVADLAKKQEERERKNFQLAGNRKQFAERQMLEAELRAAETAIVDARQALTNLDIQVQALKRWWHKRRRAALEALRPAAMATLASAETALESARSNLATLEQRAGGEFPGLSVESRRAINVAAVAYAEVLCTRLAKTQLVSLARAAVARREATDEYGGSEECQRLMADVLRARALLEVRTGLAQDVAVRVDRIKKTARYRSDADTVPLPESIAKSEADVLEQRPDGALSGRPINVIAEDSWDLFRVMLR
jgi:hypothetical protein